MEVLTTENFFDGEIFHGCSAIHLDDGRIEKIEPYVGAAQFHIVSPGLCDLQMNGFGAIDLSHCSIDDIIALDQELFELGTTSWLATVITAPLDRLFERVQFLHDVCRSAVAPGLVGIHIEGPFLGNAPGAHRPDWIVPIDMEWLQQLPDSVKLITIAPEQPQAVEATQMLTSGSVAVSMGHSRPTQYDMDNMIRAGATMVTHLFNGMSGVHHREPSMALRALVHPHITVGLIADMAHVSPDAVTLAYVAKGARGVCLVSDTVAWNSERAQRRGIKIINGSPQLADGTLAGSCTPLSACVRNVVHHAGVTVTDALVSATSTPSRILGTPDKSHVREGTPINLVALDDSLCVVGAWRALVSHRA